MVLVSGGWRAIVLLATASAGVIAGLLVFVQGFLLTRHVILNNSTCQDFGTQQGTDCWLPRTFNRTVILLIDGLRYDFAAHNASHQAPAQRLHYINKMPIFQELIDNSNQCKDKLQTDCGRGRVAFLSRFMADAPTTTMQRLKGLITGGLPTFIDVAHNFDSPRISEDNIVRQLEQNSRTITLLGDDTWRSLFPDSFSRAFLFPSFNVRDLDSVDTGVLTHLWEQLRSSDLVVAHFLGVDHAGHTFGPNHPRMEQKLLQMNAVVRDVAATISPDTLLLVLGDHGMTSSGDHGGDSASEVTAALFGYSPGPSASQASNRQQHGRYALHAGRLPPQQVVQQVSLVPTLALLLGVPIPYSSVGSLIPELFGDLQHQLPALSLNIKQVHRYLSHYDTNVLGNMFPRNMWAQLLKLKQEIDDLEDLNFDNFDADKYHHLLEKSDNFTGESVKNASKISYEILSKYQKSLYHNYLVLAKVMCEEVWATFDVNDMVSGIILMIVTIANLFCIALSVNKKDETQIYFVKGNCIITVIILVTILLKYLFRIPVLSYFPGLFTGVVVVFHFSKLVSLSLYSASKDALPIILFTLICCGNFSNSFVVYEDVLIAFSLVSLFLFQTLRIVFIHKNRTLEKNKVVSMQPVSVRVAILALSVFMCSALAVRASCALYRCREEQHGCTASTAHVPLSSVDSSAQNSRYLTGVLLLAGLAYVPRCWLSYSGNLNGMRPAVLVARYTGIVAAVMIAGYWALEAVPKPTQSILSYINYPPRIVYTLVVAAIGILLMKPLMIFQLVRNKRQEMQYSDRNNIIPELFKHLKAAYGKGAPSTSEAGTPVVYGLATALSAPIVVVAGLVLLLLVLLVGDGLAVGVVLVVVVIVGWITLHAIVCWQNPVLDSVMRLRWINPIVWFVLSLHCFYTLGHQTTFPTVPWGAAFVGLSGSSAGVGGNVLPTALVALHVYAGHVLLGLLLPLLAIAPLGLAAIYPGLRKNRSSDELRRGEFVLVDRPEVLLAAVTSTAVAYVALHATKVLCSCASALVLRRHLMVWKVFAPHLVFEALGLLVTVAAVLAGLCLALRVLEALRGWATDITLVKVKPM